MGSASRSRRRTRACRAGPPSIRCRVGSYHDGPNRVRRVGLCTARSTARTRVRAGDAGDRGGERASSQRRGGGSGIRRGARRRRRGGGILGAVGSHLIDLCRFWTGSEVAYVAGVVETFVTERKDESGAKRPVTADDFTSSVLRMASGAVATVTLSTVAHHGPGHLA